MVMGELPTAAETTEVLVIGGGPGGYAAAFRAADLGLEVTLVNAETKLGGVCLLRGCIPSKMLLYLAELIYSARAADAKGVEFGEPKVDLEKLRAWKDEVIAKLTDGLTGLCEKRGVKLVHARARFEGSNKVRLDDSDGGDIEFEHAIIATGSRPVPLPGTGFSDRIMDSAGALVLRDIPETLLVVGGGYVGLEMGMVYAALGSKVSLVETTDRLLPNADPDLVGPLAKRVEDLFESVRLNTTVADLEEQDDAVKVTLEGEESTEEEFERVLVAIGRKPNTDDLGLDSTEVELDDHGYIQVDEKRRTADQSIFAIGDAAGGMLLAHEAMAEGKVAAEVIAGEPAAFDVRAIPAVVYTDPQIAWCGLTEQEAEAQGREVEVTKFPWQASGRALSVGATEGLTKLLLDPESGRVLGVGIVGREAEALIAEGVLAVEMGAVARDLGLIIHPHPTLTETLGEAAETFFGLATHIYSGKK